MRSLSAPAPGRARRLLRRLGFAIFLVLLLPVTLSAPTDAATGLSSGVTSIDAGYGHACAVDASSSVKCWGKNDYAQLADGVSVDRTQPAEIAAAGASGVSANGGHTCITTAGNQAQCWGSNYWGEIGDGTFTDRSVPVNAAGTDSYAAVSAGYFHSCGVTTLGGAKCWGRNSDGGLGNGTYNNSLTAVDVQGLTSGVASVVAIWYYSCAVTDAGGAKCWGYNFNGQLGDGTTVRKTSPVDVVGLTSGVASMAGGGNHTCAVTTAGGLKCWGWGYWGQLGDGSGQTMLTPADVSGLMSGVQAVTAGFNHTCALTTDGAVKCWGRNTSGQVGDGSKTTRSTPVGVSGLSSGVAEITAGDQHTCALTTSGGVLCWGSNAFGQLGDGTTVDKKTPVAVSGLGSGVASITAGATHTCALLATGDVRCWGRNNDGQLGNAQNPNTATPTSLNVPITDAVSVGAGQFHSCAMLQSGGAKCWGWNYDGQLGDGTMIDRATPVTVSGLTGAVQMAVGNSHACVLTTAGGVKCWGWNFWGQLGDGTLNRDRLTPVDVVGLTSGVKSIAARGNHTCAITTAGALKCWGSNAYGELGDGTKTRRPSPTDVPGLSSGVAGVALGLNHTCALLEVGSIKCWGWNKQGQLGDGTKQQRLTPVDVVGITDGQQIALGGYHSCAILASGPVKCWGDNEFGELGDASRFSRIMPRTVSTTATIVRLVGGAYDTCALTDTGRVLCWGWGAYGQIGNGSYSDALVPTA